VILRNVNQSFRDHNGDSVRGIAQALYPKLQHIKTLSKNFVAEYELRSHLPHNGNLIVFNNLIRHSLAFSLLLTKYPFRIFSESLSLSDISMFMIPDSRLEPFF